MAEAKNESQKKQSPLNEALYNLNYKVTSALPDGLQKLQVSACDHMGSKYPHAACQGVRDAVVDGQSR